MFEFSGPDGEDLKDLPGALSPASLEAYSTTLAESGPEPGPAGQPAKFGIGCRVKVHNPQSGVFEPEKRPPSHFLKMAQTR